MQHSFLASDGSRIAYTIDDFTDPWRPPETLLLLHAAMGSSRRWYAAVPPLARHYRVVRMDLRGHGESQVPPPEPPLTMDRLVQDVRIPGDRLGFQPGKVLEELESFADVDERIVSSRVPSELKDPPFFLIPKELRRPFFENLLKDAPEEAQGESEAEAEGEVADGESAAQLNQTELNRIEQICKQIERIRKHAEVVDALEEELSGKKKLSEAKRKEVKQ